MKTGRAVGPSTDRVLEGSYRCSCPRSTRGSSISTRRRDRAAAVHASCSLDVQQGRLGWRRSSGQAAIRSRALPNLDLAEREQESPTERRRSLDLVLLASEAFSKGPPSAAAADTRVQRTLPAAAAVRPRCLSHRHDGDGAADLPTSTRKGLHGSIRAAHAWSRRYEIPYFRRRSGASDHCEFWGPARRESYGRCRLEGTRHRVSLRSRHSPAYLRTRWRRAGGITEIAYSPLGDPAGTRSWRGVEHGSAVPLLSSTRLRAPIAPRAPSCEMHPLSPRSYDGYGASSADRARRNPRETEGDCSCASCVQSPLRRSGGGLDGDDPDRGGAARERALAGSLRRCARRARAGRLGIKRKHYRAVEARVELAAGGRCVHFRHDTRRPRDFRRRRRESGAASIR